MTGRGHQLIHADAFAAELEALGLDSSIFRLGGVPAPVLLNLVPRRAGVFDALPNTFGFADFSSAFTRASDGMYLDAEGRWKIAGSNALRAEYASDGSFLGILFEKESTNKCENYNLDPDASLTNVTKSGDAAATLTRVQDAAALATYGLQAITADNYVFKLDNSAGSTAALATVSGTCGNTNTHTISAVARLDSASAGACALDMDGVFTGIAITGTAYSRFEATDSPDATTRQLQVSAAAGGIVYFVLNQLEEQVLATSPIVTVGASATRADDNLSYPVTDYAGNKLFSQDAGMVALRWRPKFVSADAAGVSQHRIVRVHSGSELIYYQSPAGTEAIRTWDSTNPVRTAAISGGVSVNDLLLCCVRFSNLKTQIGYKRDGAWVWSTEATYDGTYGEGFISVNSITGSIKLPSHASHLMIWDQDEGSDFLEKFFAGVAN